MVASKTTWVVNPVTGKLLVAPKLGWLLDRLASINRQAAVEHPKVVDHYGHQIYGSWLAYRTRGDGFGLKITGTMRLRTTRIVAGRGTTNELRRLLIVARGTSENRWRTAWLGVSSETRGLVWSPTPPPIARYFLNSRGRIVGFERGELNVRDDQIVRTRKLHIIMPTREEAVPLIEAALRKHTSNPASERSERKADAFVDDFARAVVAAYWHLTGERGITWDPVREKWRGGLNDLRRDINEHFQTEVLTIDRLRKNFPENYNLP